MWHLIDHLEVGAHDDGTRGGRADAIWNPDGWSTGTSDGFLSAAFTVSPTGLLETHGLMTFLSANAGVPCFVEPFCARVRLSADGDSLADYALGLGAPSQQLGAVPFGSRQHRVLENQALLEKWEVDNDWAFVFSARGSDAEQDC